MDLTSDGGINRFGVGQRQSEGRQQELHERHPKLHLGKASEHHIGYITNYSQQFGIIADMWMDTHCLNFTLICWAGKERRGGVGVINGRVWTNS